MAKPTKPESQMTQMEKAKLAAERVKGRQDMKKEAPKSMKKDPESPNAAALKPMKRPSYLDSMSPEEQVQEMKRIKKSDKAYEESRMIKPEGYKKGGMVTARGQGKVSRTRKTRIC
jgi:hypothetical protein